jgi:cell division topological specificity factor
MLDFLRWLISQRDSNKDRERTKDTAHNRLRLVLIQDRLDLSPELMAAMKRDIRQVVSRYMVVDDDFIEFEVRRLDELMVLVSNIEVKELNQLAPA